MQMRSFASLALVTAWGSRNTPRRTLDMEPDLLLAVFFFFDEFLIVYA